MARHLGIALLALCACSAPVDRQARWILADGRTVVEFSPGGDPYVVLIMDPDEVFACAGILAEWLEWRRHAPNHFRLVYSREPSRAERRHLATVRLPLAGTLATAPTSTPIEMLVSRGRIVHLGRGVRTVQQSGLLGPLRSRSTEAVAGRMKDDVPQPITHGGPR